jgi:hypothetical protein
MAIARNAVLGTDRGILTGSADTTMFRHEHLIYDEGASF